MLLGNLFRKIVQGTLAAARTGGGEFLLRKTDYGLVHVEYDVVRRIAERAIINLRGVSDVEVALEKSASAAFPLRINLTVTLAEGFSAPRTSEAADKKINEALTSILGENFRVPVTVKINRIEQIAVKKRRVR